MSYRYADFEDYAEDDFDYDGDFEDYDDYDDEDDLFDDDGFDDDFDDDDEDDFVDYLDDDDDFDDDFDAEGDEFFRKLWRKVKKGAKKVAGRLARVAKKHAGKIGTVIGGAVGGPAGAAIGGRIGGIVKNLEDEDDGFDSEDEMNATIRIPTTDSDMAEAMAAAASKSRPSDAQALGGALTITIMSRTPMKVKSVAPAVASAAGRVAKVMASDPKAKPLIKTLPSIVEATTASLKRKSDKGKKITNRTAGRVMTKQAKRILRSRPRLAKALAKNTVKRRRLNKKAIARAEKYY